METDKNNSENKRSQTALQNTVLFWDNRELPDAPYDVEFRPIFELQEESTKANTWFELGVFLRYQTKQNTPFFFLRRDLSQEGRKEEEEEGRERRREKGGGGRGKEGEEGGGGSGQGRGGERKQILKFSLLESEYAT